METETKITETTESTDSSRIEKRYVGVKETLTYGVANAGQCIGYTTMIQQRSYFLSAVLGVTYTLTSISHTVSESFLNTDIAFFNSR